MKKDYMIIAFSSTHQAIRFERLLIEHFAIELIPTPRDVSASCGLSLKFEAEDLKAVLETVKDEAKSGLQLIHFDWIDGNLEMIALGWGD